MFPQSFRELGYVHNFGTLRLILFICLLIFHCSRQQGNDNFEKQQTMRLKQYVQLKTVQIVDFFYKKLHVRQCPFSDANRFSAMINTTEQTTSKIRFMICIDVIRTQSPLKVRFRYCTFIYSKFENNFPYIVYNNQQQTIQKTVTKSGKQFLNLKADYPAGISRTINIQFPLKHAVFVPQIKGMRDCLLWRQNCLKFRKCTGIFTVIY